MSTPGRGPGILLPAVVALLVGCGGGAWKLLPVVAATTPVGEGGGTITGPRGEQLLIPAGALTGPASVKVTPVSQSDVQGALAVDLPGSGLIFLGAVAIDTSMPFAKPATLSLPFASSLPGAGQVLVARVGPDLTGEGKSALVLQEVASPENGRLRTLSPPFPGIGGAGTYVFLQPVNPVRFITGRVVSESGAPLDGAWVTTLEMPALAARAAKGVFVAAVPAAARAARLLAMDGARALFGFVNVPLPAGSVLPPAPVLDFPATPRLSQMIADLLNSQCADPDFSTKKILNDLANTALKTLIAEPAKLELVPEGPTTIAPNRSVTFAGDASKFFMTAAGLPTLEGKINLFGLPKMTARLTRLSVPRLFDMNPHPAVLTESSPGVVLQPITATMSPAGVFSFTVTGQKNGTATIVDNGVRFGFAVDVSWTLTAEGEATRNCVLPGVPLEVKPENKNVIAGPVTVTVSDAGIKIDSASCVIDPVGVGHVGPKTQRVNAALTVQGPVGSSARAMPADPSIRVTTPVANCGPWTFGLGNDVNCTRGPDAPETVSFVSNFWCEGNGCPAVMEIQAILFASGSTSPNLARDSTVVACPRP